MKIIRRCTAHKRKAYFVECKYCDSELRILEGDPEVSVHYTFELTCPVCGERQRFCLDYACHEVITRTITLTKEDREEIASWTKK